MENKSIATIAIAITLLLIGGYTLHQYSADDPEANYQCDSLKITKYCDHLSATGGRCYPLAGSTKGYKDCFGGWEPIPAKAVQEPVTQKTNQICCPVCPEGIKNCCYPKVGDNC